MKCFQASLKEGMRTDTSAKATHYPSKMCLLSKLVFFPMAFFTMGQVCLIHHHFLRGPSSTRSSGHRRSPLWIHQLLKNCPGGSQTMAMGNHGKPWWKCHRPCRSHHLRKRQRFQLHRLGAIESMFRKWEPDKAT